MVWNISLAQQEKIRVSYDIKMHLSRSNLCTLLLTLLVFLPARAVAQEPVELDEVEEEVEVLTEQTQIQEPDRPSEYENTEPLTYPEGVEVEKSVYSSPQKKCDCEYTYLSPYVQRRGSFGFTVAVGYSSYTPTNYKPDFVVNETMSDYYSSPETPLTELTLGFKWNNSLGSISLDFGAGYYVNDGSDGARLTLIPVRGGATLALDNLGSEPNIVPYGTIGAYSVIYEESLASQKVGGNTSVGLFYAGGVQFALNALDQDSAIASYDDTGLENTFLYVEARSFIASDDIPDLGAPIQLGGGLKLEY